MADFRCWSLHADLTRSVLARSRILLSHLMDRGAHRRCLSKQRCRGSHGGCTNAGVNLPEHCARLDYASGGNALSSNAFRWRLCDCYVVPNFSVHLMHVSNQGLYQVRTSIDWQATILNLRNGPHH